MRKLKRLVPGACLLLVLGVLLAVTAHAQEYPEGMVAYWKFEEGSGATASDSVGTNHGAVYGAFWTAGLVGGALSFDGDDYIDFGNDPSLQIGSGDYSVELWLRTGSSKTYWEVIVGACDSSAGKWWRMQYWPSTDQFIYWDDDGIYRREVSADLDLNNGAWHHIVAVQNFGLNHELYVDDVLVGTSADNEDSSSENPLKIGQVLDEPTFFLHGDVDEVAVYDRALTRAEISQHYENGLQGIGYELVLVLQCVGFEPPMADYPVGVKGNRALPLKAELLDGEGYGVSGADVTAPPVIQVWYEYGTPDAEDVSDEVLPAGQGTEGNQFVYTDEGKWQFNLKTKNYTAPGTYTVLMDSGDDSEYVIDPTCVTEFVIK